MGCKLGVTGSNLLDRSLPEKYKGTLEEGESRDRGKKNQSRGILRVWVRNNEDSNKSNWTDKRM